MSRPTPLLLSLALAAVVIPAAAIRSQAGQPSAPVAHSTHAVPAPSSSATSAQRLPLTVQGASVVAVPPGATETSAGMTLRNPGKTPVVLTSARSSAAGHVMLMTTRRDAQGRVGMSGVKSLTVPAGGQLILKPGGDHLMLMDLMRPLKPGERVPLVLVARDGRTLTVSATVRLP
ncbi:copper(I)-binding protein [Deinococcus sp. HSC-46F16]|uniref:copper chaperone PCu(A)C n=1 Tax=Deinococcus sp. HSC-46F16 TaxID=2910968 RepID=UPI00209C9581|nr:copper chaperone PCu(A)C [Deinococcus sp. HSC-46F16]MCP2015708.1 copper(I)-binding protein [Deinococcus sp. HSC-46F16]